jgi:hypothetical protein
MFLRGKNWLANSIWFVNLRNILLLRFFSEAKRPSHLHGHDHGIDLLSSTDLYMKILLLEAKAPLLGMHCVLGSCLFFV